MTTGVLPERRDARRAWCGRGDASAVGRVVRDGLWFLEGPCAGVKFV